MWFKTYKDKLLNEENDWDQDTTCEISKEGPMCRISTHEDM